MRTEKNTEGMGHGEKKREFNAMYVAIVTLLIAFSSAGCGYRIHSKADLPFQSITISKIINKTFEPRLEDKMQVVLADELLRNGFAIDSTSAFRINGIINTFELRILSEKASVAVEYEVVIKGDFRLIDPSGKERRLRSQGVFLVSFQSSGSLPSVMASKELATERALRDFSSEIVASIIFDRTAGDTMPPKASP